MMKNIIMYLGSFVVLLLNCGDVAYENWFHYGESEQVVYEFNQAEGVVEWTDPRDGQVYGVLDINGVKWMVDNYNFNGGEAGVYNYGPGPMLEDGQVVQKKFRIESTSAQKKHGRLYSYEAAISLAPEGWRLPDEKDWEALIDFLGWDLDAAVLSEDWFYKRSEAVNLLTSGYKDNSLNFSEFGNKGLYWLESGIDCPNASYYKKMHRNYALEKGRANKNFGLSVRYIME